MATSGSNTVMRRHPVIKVLALTLAAGAAPAMAQIGTMAYGPITAVPVGGGLFLAVLGMLLGVVAWVYSRRIVASRMLSTLLLVTAATVFSISGGKLMYQAYAIAATALSNPQGGTVDIYAGYQEYENTSGVPLRIGSIDIDSCPQAQGDALAAAALPACEPGSTVLADGEICTTNYQACAGERVTFQAGYYWVRASYPAPSSAHASVCAEFGYDATASSVPLTWDANLLQSVATAFGYQSAGDYDDAAPSMWCFDGDGFSNIQGGYCGTHNFASSYTNYGAYSGDSDERPVFTCVPAAP